MNFSSFVFSFALVSVFAMCSESRNAASQSKCSFIECINSSIHRNRSRHNIILSSAFNTTAGSVAIVATLWMNTKQHIKHSQPCAFCISSVPRISHNENSWLRSLENGRKEEGPSCDAECEYLIVLHLS